MTTQPKRINVELRGRTDKDPETWTATITYGHSLTGRPLRYITYGYSMGEALKRMARVVKRDGVPIP